jgi:glycerol-3-phosphate dehydrogenase (NAD(P)+)
MYFAALAGGMIAEEVTTGVPIAADIACAIPEVATILQQLFTTPTFRIRTTTDVIGVELAGAFKNVLAIGAGLFGKDTPITF